MARKNNTVDFSNQMGAMFSSPPNHTEEPNIDILNDVSRDLITGERISRIKRNKIELNARNEIVYDVKELDALAKDISERGIQEPLLLRLKPDGKYIITSGHRRFAANEIAIEKYGYDGEYLPCIVRDNISDSIDEREALILNNLQRDKSDYNRMMEIVEMRQCAEERRDRGETIINIRHYLMERLGVSNSEISRFERIHSSLIPELMLLFRAERIATNVAHEIAKLDRPAQEFIYRNWHSSDETEMLAFPIMSNLLEQYQQSIHSDLPAEKATIETSKKQKIQVSSIDEGITEISSCLKTVLSQIKSCPDFQDAKTEKKMLRQINKVYSELLVLQEYVLRLAQSTSNE